MDGLFTARFGKIPLASEPSGRHYPRNFPFSCRLGETKRRYISRRARAIPSSIKQKNVRHYSTPNFPLFFCLHVTTCVFVTAGRFDAQRVRTLGLCSRARKISDNLPVICFFFSFPTQGRSASHEDGSTGRPVLRAGNGPAVQRHGVLPAKSHRLPPGDTV